MIFTPRLSNLLLILVKHDTYIPISKLASEINTSKRTVFRELENIDKLLLKYNLKLNKKTGSGIWLEGSVEDKSKLINLLNNKEENEPIDKENRRKKLILEILRDKDAKKLYYYSNLFKVSETTISTDMEAIIPWFEKYNLKLIKKQGYGVSLEGNEKNYRKALTKFITDNIDDKSIIEIFNSNDRKFEIDKFMVLNNKNSIYNLMNKDILNKVIVTIKSINDKKILAMTESSYIGLIIHLTIAVDRILKHEKINIDKDLEQKLKVDENYKVSQKISKSLETEFQIEIPESEIAYICIHIKGAKLQYVDKSHNNKDFFIDNCDLTKIIHKMIDRYDNSISYELKIDTEFLEGLIVHMQPTLIRLKYKMEIVNPLLEQVETEYPEIFENSKRAASVISEEYGYEIPDDEIGFLAMHFGAAIVRLTDKKITMRKVSIAVVCASGIGVSFLISSKLKNIFKDRINVTTYAKDEINQKVLNNVDILVSTFYLDYLTEKSIIINPLLLDNDLDKIKKQIEYYSYVEKDYIDDNNLDFLKQLEDIKPIVEYITFIINSFDISYINYNIEFNELIKTISSKFSDCYERNEIIYNDLIAREKIATQVVEEYKFVLLHSRTSGIESPIFSVILPDQSEFSNKYFKNSQAIIVMLAPRKSNHSQMAIMGNLSATLVEDEKFLKLIKSGKKEETKAFIDNNLKKYFMNYLKEMY